MPDVKDWESGKKKLTREQKVGFTLLLVFAVFAIGLGIMQIRNTMYAPFALGSGIPSEIAVDEGCSLSLPLQANKCIYAR